MCLTKLPNSCQASTGSKTYINGTDFCVVYFFYLMLAKNASSIPKSYCEKMATLVLVLLNKIILYFLEFFQCISATLIFTQIILNISL